MPFSVPAPFLPEVGACATMVPRWGIQRNGEKQAWDTQTQPICDFLWQTPFPQGWKTNGLITQNAVLFASAKLTVCIQPHSQVSPTTSWENAEQTEIMAWTPGAGLALFAFYYKAYLAVSYG